MKDSITIEFIIKQKENIYKTGLNFCRWQSVLNDYRNKPFLHKQEEEKFLSFTFSKRKKSYLIGRYATKQAASIFSNESDLKTIFVDSGVFMQPILRYSALPNFQVSLSHTNDFAGAIIFPEELPMAIDLEHVYNDTEAVEKYCTNIRERELLKQTNLKKQYALVLLWTIKEAISKVLKTGMQTHFSVFEVNIIERFDGHYISYFKNFPQYKVISFLIDDYFCSILLPEKSDFITNITNLKNQVNQIFTNENYFSKAI